MKQGIGSDKKEKQEKAKCMKILFKIHNIVKWQMMDKEGVP